MSIQHNCLTPGIRKRIPLGIVKKQLVSDVMDSETRERNFSGFINFIEKLKELNISDCITKFWIDGSFVSQKVNPNDIDMVFFLDITHPSSKIVMDNRSIFREIGESLHCDTYYTFDHETVPPENPDVKAEFDYQKKYWMGQFCFDRNEQVKAIIELTMEDFMERVSDND